MRPVAVNADGLDMGIVARARCGCVQGLALDVPGDDHLLFELRAWKRNGWALARMPLSELPTLTGVCSHWKPKARARPDANDPVLVRR